MKRARAVAGWTAIVTVAVAVGGLALTSAKIYLDRADEAVAAQAEADRASDDRVHARLTELDAKIERKSREIREAEAQGANRVNARNDLNSAMAFRDRAWSEWSARNFTTAEKLVSNAHESLDRIPPPPGPLPTPGVEEAHEVGPPLWFYVSGIVLVIVGIAALAVLVRRRSREE